MNKFLLVLIIPLVLFSCKQQSKESKKEAEQTTTPEESYTPIALKNSDTLSLDPKFAKRLTPQETASIFTRRIKRQYEVTYPIRQAYSYQDEAGSYYVALAQDQSEITKEGDTLYDKLQGLILTKKGNGLKKKSSINDETDNDWETSIFFWNHYSEIKDFDNDGLADLILVYGTTGQEDYADGRMKMMIYHKGKRITVRHQNSDYDGRLTKISSRFYSLPEQLQKVVIDKMRAMTKNKHATFSANWENKMMKDKATQLEDL